MSNLTLQQTNASGPLVPSTLAQALARLATRTGERAPKAKMRGQILRLALDLSLDDDACVAFRLDFAAQGARMRGEAHGPSADGLSWVFHALAALLGCALVETDGGAAVEPRPDTYREAAVAYLAAYEAEVRADREGRSARHEEDGTAFLDWLAREEHIALAGEAGELGATLPMNDASALYAQLLESEDVEDVFISESELEALLARFHARWAVTR